MKGWIRGMFGFQSVLHLAWKMWAKLFLRPYLEWIVRKETLVPRGSQDYQDNLVAKGSLEKMVSLVHLAPSAARPTPSSPSTVKPTALLPAPTTGHSSGMGSVSSSLMEMVTAMDKIWVHQVHVYVASTPYLS